MVDRALLRVIESLDEHGMADDTIVVLTSDHGDLLGSHGGMMQKWYNAYDETIRVPFVVKGPGVQARAEGVVTPTSHVDLIPTLLGLAGVDVDAARARLAETHTEAQELPGRDLSAVVRGSAPESAVAAPVYFMTDDDISRGLSMGNVLTGEPYQAVDEPKRVESVIAPLPAGDGDEHLWKLSHYYERLDDWTAAHGIAPNPFASPAAESMYELYDLTADPEERTNLADTDAAARAAMLRVLDEQRDTKRLLPRLRNPVESFPSSAAQGVAAGAELRFVDLTASETLGEDLLRGAHRRRNRDRLPPAASRRRLRDRGHEQRDAGHGGDDHDDPEHPVDVPTVAHVVTHAAEAAIEAVPPVQARGAQHTEPGDHEEQHAPGDRGPRGDVPTVALPRFGRDGCGRGGGNCGHDGLRCVARGVRTDQYRAPG